MKKTTAYTEFLMIALALAPLAYLVFIWPELPPEMATHYGLSGRPDGWMRKENAALFLGIMALLLYAVLRFLPSFDPKGRFQTANFLKLRFVATFFFSAVMGAVFYMAAHQSDTISTMRIILALVALMIAGMGNYMTSMKPNYFVGIRTPWTLRSDEVWRRTHQLGGWLMVAGGLLAAVLAFMVPAPYTAEVVAGIILLSAVIPVIYSYVYFRQEKARA